MNFLKSTLVLFAVLLGNLSLWLANNLPFHPQEAGYPLQSVSFNPYQKHQNPLSQEFPSEKEISRDLEKLVGKTLSVRTYTSSDIFGKIPKLAAEHKLKVVASAWLDERTENNEIEVSAAIQVAGKNRNVSRLIIGNETQLHGLVPKEDLIRYLKTARRALFTPVSTAEPWDFWIKNPSFVQHVDFIAIHILPYWVEIPIEKAVPYVIEKYKAVQKAFPGKVVLISETGWPSFGPQKGAAVASTQNQARFIREFYQAAQKEKIPYNIIEAFDQPWKDRTEGEAGAHWGIMDADRELKFPIKGPVLEDPNWKYWGFSSAVIAFCSISLYLIRRRKLRLIGKLFSAIILQSATSAAVLLAREASDQYMSPEDICFWTVLICAQALLAVIFITDASEIADVVGEKPLKRRFLPAVPLPTHLSPFVSLHLACCKEPPEMVIATLESLSRLEYPNFEVIVVDNNTPDESLWRPVQQRCIELGSHFRFYSLGKWPGFKAGALNFALKETDPKAEVIGVVDADYVVEPNWISVTVPYFQDTNVALVQCPQEHRAWEGSMFRMMENDEYSGFFRIGMVQRNEDNAIIQHGTMTLVSRGMLDSLNGWAEWCICEDAELGLRILNEGKQSIYIDQPLGHGLVPDSYEAYAKQRFRWAYGGMRILRRHCLALLGLTGKLTLRQRYHFIRGWLPWIGDALHCGFTLAGITWSAMLIAFPKHTALPAPIMIYPALALVALRIVGTYWTYTTRVKIGKRRTLLALIAGGALTHSIAKAVIQGLLTSSRPFFRTPKMATTTPLLRNLFFVREELILGAVLCLCAAGIILRFGVINDEAFLWSIALVTQAFPYFAAILAAVVSSIPERGARKTELLPSIPVGVPEAA